MAQQIEAGGQAPGNGAGDIPWIKTPIYLVTQDEMADFACTHQFWLNIDDVYKNAPDKKPACK